jgi:hypothetical protein
MNMQKTSIRRRNSDSYSPRVSLVFSYLLYCVLASQVTAQPEHGFAPVISSTTIAFDGGTSVVSSQNAGEWSYYRIIVPEDALGWDLRLIDVNTGHPQMVVCRDLLPDGLSTTPE